MLNAASSRRARSLPPNSYGSSALAGILSSGGSGGTNTRSTRFGPLRSTLGRPGKETIALGRGRKSQRLPGSGARRSNGLHKMDSVGKKRIPDYTDIAYREAVSRLRYLLNESYTSPHRSPFRGLSYSSGRGVADDSAGEDTDAVIERTRALLSPYRRPLYTPVRRNLYAPTSRSPNRPAAPSVHLEAPPQEVQTAPTTPRAGLTNPAENSGQLPPEMMAYIERQEEYIDQLERESHFCREELTSLLGKVKEVISENEGLQEKQKTGVLKSVFDYLHSENEDEEEEDEDTEASEIEPRKKKRERRYRLEGPNIVFESRISELEAHLTQVRIDLKKAQDEAELYKKRLSGEGLLTDVSGAEPESLRHQMEALKREKDELADTVSKLQNTVAQLREREADTTHRLKRSQEAVEQAQFEKSQGELEIRRLKDELDRLHGKLREAVAEQGRRAADERAGVERRFQQQIEQLQSDLTAQWDSSGRMQLDLEKQRRIEAELRREIANKNATLDEMAKETQAKIDVLQGELSAAMSQHTTIGQELATAQLQADRAEREGRHESKRLGAEISALRERLDRADSETLRARQEALRLSEQLAALDREMTLNKTKGSADTPASLREQEMTTLIKNMEDKHVETVAELEGMIQSQNQVMAKLKDECHILTQRLEDSSARHKQERLVLREENCELRATVENLHAELEGLSSSRLHDYNQTWRPHCMPVAKMGETLDWSQRSGTMSLVNQPLAPEHINPHHKNKAHTSSQQNRGEIITNIPPRGGGYMSPRSSREEIICTQKEQIPTNLQKEEEIMKLVKESENLNLQKEKTHINQREWIAQQWKMLDKGQETTTPLHQDPLTNSLSELIQEINLNYPQVETRQVMIQKEWKAHQTHCEQDLTWKTSMDRDREIMMQHISNHQTKDQPIMNPQRLYTSNQIETLNPPRDHQLSMITPPQLLRRHMTEVPCRNPQIEPVTNHQFRYLQVEHINPQFNNPQAEHLQHHLPMYNNLQKEQAPQRRLPVEHQRDQRRHEAMDLTEAPQTQQQTEQAHVQASNEWEVMKHQQENSHDLAAQRGIHQDEEWSSKDDNYLPGPPLTLQDLIS